MNKGMAIPIIEGVYIKGNDYRSFLPENVMIVGQNTGIANYYLRPAEGIVLSGVGPGVCAGAIKWNGDVYALMGATLVNITPSGSYSTVASGIHGAGLAKFDYSFDRLAFSYGETLYYWNGTRISRLGEKDGRPTTVTLTGTTDDTGTYSAFMVSSMDGGSAKLTATHSALSTSLDVRFTSFSDEFTSLVLTSSAATIVANGVSTCTITATTNLAFSDILFKTTNGFLNHSKVTSDSAGVSEVILTSNTEIGKTTVTVIAGNFGKTIDVEFVSGTATSATALCLPVITLSESCPLSVYVVDALGLPVSGQAVTFTIQTNTSGCSLSASTGTTNEYGYCYVNYTAGGVSGTDVLKVDLGGGISDTVDVFTGTPASTVTSIVPSSSATIVADGTTATPISVTVKNEFSAVVVGATVYFYTNLGTLSAASAVTNSSGIASVNLTSTKTIGTAKLTIVVEGRVTTHSLSFVSGAATQLTLYGSSTTSKLDTISSLMAVIQDANNNPCASQDAVITLVNGGSAYLSKINTGILHPTAYNTNPLYKVIDFVWMDGYFLYTDGESIVATSLLDPTIALQLSYGSSEADPDPINCLLKLRGELWALNRNSIEAFQNVGTGLFPFARVTGTRVARGAVGPRMGIVIKEQIVFVGGGRNEQISVWTLNGSQTTNISTREVDKILNEYPETTLAGCLMEVRTFEQLDLLYIHLPDRTLVFDPTTTRQIQPPASTIPVWTVLHSGINRHSEYLARNFVYAYGNWIAFDKKSGFFGYMSKDVSTHWGSQVGWQFNTPIMYNAGQGFIINSIELVCNTVTVAFLENPIITTSYSTDGETWSQEFPIRINQRGTRDHRLVWFQQGVTRHQRIQKFKGTSDSQLTVGAVVLNIEPLSV